jgi:hypothetical protein
VLGAPLVAVAAVVAGEGVGVGEGAGLAVGDGAILAGAVGRQVVEAGALLADSGGLADEAPCDLAGFAASLGEVVAGLALLAGCGAVVLALRAVAHRALLALPVDQVFPLLALQADARWVTLLALLQQAARAHARGLPQRVLGLAAETGAVGAVLAVGIGAVEAAAIAEIVAWEALAAVCVALAEGASDARAGLAAQRLALGLEKVTLEAGGAGPEVAVLAVFRRAGRALGVAIAVAGEAVGAGRGGGAGRAAELRAGLTLVVLLGVEVVAGAAGGAEVKSALAGKAVGGAAGEAAAVAGVGVGVHVAVVEASQAVALLVAGRAQVGPAALAEGLRTDPHQEGPLLTLLADRGVGAY